MKIRTMMQLTSSVSGSGHTAEWSREGAPATAWYVPTEILGRMGVRVYDGSWAEWGLIRDTPVETQPASALQGKHVVNSPRTA